MAIGQRPEWLAMKALGVDGGQELADGSLMAAGIHLRWDFDSDLGFPRGGFDVYRRPHEPGQLWCGVFFPEPDGGVVLGGNDLIQMVNVTVSGERNFVDGCGQPIPDTALQLPGLQTLRLDMTEPARHVKILLDPASPAPIVGDAYWRKGDDDVLVDRALARQGAPGDPWTVRLYADRIDSVLLRGRDMVVCQVCYVLVEDSLTVNWGAPLNAPDVIHLPITSAEWPGVHPHQPDDVAEADARLPTGLPAEARDAYLTGFEDELHPILFDLVSTQPQQMAFVDEPGTGDGQQPAPTRLRWQSLQLLRLAALDPNLARILGLYWHDATAQAGQRYDYRIVAHWDDRPFPGQRFDFARLTPGSRYTTGVDYDGLRIVSPNLITVIEDTWDGVAGNALEAAALLPNAPVAITLPQPAESITLFVKADGNLNATAYAGLTTVSNQDLAAGEQAIAFEDTRGITLVQLESAARIVIIACVARKKAGTLGDVEYATFHHEVGSPRRVPETALTSATALPGQTRLAEDGSILTGQSVGLRWQPPDVDGDSLPPDAPIFYLVQRASRGDGETPGRPGDAVILNADAPVLLSRRALLDGGGAVSGLPLPGYVDRHLPDGWYSYRVRGIDLFGRLSAWGEPQTVQVRDRVKPPPPANVTAAYLDPADRYLTADDAPHAPGIKVTWEWQGAQHFQAPDVANAPGEFRIFFEPGELNTLQGRVLSVAYYGATSTLVADATWTGAPDTLAGERLRVGGAYYEVVSHRNGPPLQIAVNNLTLPDQSPTPGPFTLTLSPGSAAWKDYRQPAAWQRRIHAEPAIAAPVVSGQIVAVADSSTPGRITVTTDQALDDAAEVLTPGLLVCNGLAYAVRHHDMGGALTLELSPRPVPSDPPEPEQATVQPAPGDSFTYTPGRRYTVYLPAAGFTPETGSGTTVANIGVTAADGAAGNQSAVSGPARIIAVERAILPAVADVPVAGDAPIFARPADYYGKARYTLTWSPLEGAAEYAVCRCSGGAFFDQDSKLRRERKGYYADPAIDPFADDPDFAAWLAANYPDLTAETLTTDAWRDWAAHFYPALPDSRIQDIANRPGNEAAFRRVNAETVSGVSFTDTFDGLGQGFYLYRVRAINAAGAPGAWSGAYPPVHIYDVTPPAPPILTGVAGGERSITVRWRANTERDLAAYHIWRAEDPAALADVRRLPPLAVLAPSPGVVAEAFTDADLPAGVPYHYRIAAIDTNGNLSRPSALAAGQAVDTSIPAPPEWRSARWHNAGVGILLRWTLAEEAHEAMMQRSSPQTGGLWLSITGWLPAGTERYADLTADASLTNAYRLRVRSASGNLSDSYNEIEVSPAAGEDA
ncbi:MAG: hypothetical protein IT323_00460 [Anaerolineae bacterium]|nr:hypothetical protein [Anaerolineae bacterium]